MNPHHLFLRIAGSQPQRDFRIGIAIPCYKDDWPFLKTCLESVKKLSPQPYVTVVDINWNSTIDIARKKLSEYLFYKEKCDVVLHTIVDGYLFPNILKRVKRGRIVSFQGLNLKRYDLTFALYHLMFPGMGWSGCYSLPRESWEQIKDKLENYDSGIWRATGRFQYDFCRNYTHYNLRPYKKSSVQELLKTMSLRKRLLWRMIRLGIG